MTKEQILKNQVVPEVINGVYADLFNKLVDEMDEFTNKIADMSAIEALDKYSKDYDNRLSILLSYSDLVDSKYINNSNVDSLLTTYNLLSDLADRYGHYMETYTFENNEQDFWSDLIDEEIVYGDQDMPFVCDEPEEDLS